MKKLTIQFIVLSFVIIFGQSVFAQTTGKIAGSVTDAASDEPLAGANVYLENSSLGASVDLDGAFYIINVPPGTYTVVVQMVGYQTQNITDFRVSVNRTAYLDAKLKTSIMESEVIEVQADKIAEKKDQTSSMNAVSSEEMEALPVESIEGVISLQAGVVAGHFRGGRSNEVSYMIDGLPVNDAFSGEGRVVEPETESIEDLEVITGTFNAEYGRAMSGVVNAVTKNGGMDFSASASASVAGYLTKNSDIFIGLDGYEPARNQDYKFQIGGPLLLKDLTFFANARYQENKNHLNGINRYEMDDYSDYYSLDPNEWIIQHSGDGSYEPMNSSKNISLFGKLAYKITNHIRTSLLYTLNDDQWNPYAHIYKYNPDGRASSYRKTSMLLFNVNHTLSNSAFYEVKLSYIDNYDGWYLYKNPVDNRFLYDGFRGNESQTGFYTGGQSKDHSETWQKDLNAKFDLTWQISNQHAIKTGFLFTSHDLTNEWKGILADSNMTVNQLDEFYIDENGKRVYYNYSPQVQPNISNYSDLYNVKPIELSAYIQDKMEFGDMVINLGIRFDYFDPKTVIPSQRRNPANQLNFYLKDDKGNLILDEQGNQMLDPERMSTYPEADIKYQLSPRFGLAYQLGDKAVLRFSYGHFFQMPPMYALYQNNSFLVDLTTHYATTMGDAQLKAQKTVKYEIGLWLELVRNMDFEIALYYNDIYNLLSTKVVTTFNQVPYGLYTNKDYGNSRGLELRYNYRYNNFNMGLNYTLAYTRGNADNPTMTFTRAGASQDPINKLIPLNWDQRHTLNLTVGYQMGDLGLTLITYYNSGTPYSWQPIPLNPLSNLNLQPNNATRASSYSMDLNAWYAFDIFNGIDGKLRLSIYNLLDNLNAAWVYPTTGQPYRTIIQESDLDNHRSDFNTYMDRVEDPSAYVAPRMVKLGLEVGF